MPPPVCLLRTETGLILIDTGMGDKQNEKFFGYYYLWGDDNLDKSLKKHGFHRDDITDVFTETKTPGKSRAQDLVKPYTTTAAQRSGRDLCLEVQWAVAGELRAALPPRSPRVASRTLIWRDRRDGALPSRARFGVERPRQFVDADVRRLWWAAPQSYGLTRRRQGIRQGHPRMRGDDPKKIEGAVPAL